MKVTSPKSGIVLLASLLMCFWGCAPTYAIGTETEVKRKLLDIVPLRSTVSDFRRAAARQSWTVVEHRTETLEEGKRALFHKPGRECRGKGGPVLYAVVSRYHSPLLTVVETLWVFDSAGRLKDLCVRKVKDAL